MLKNLEKENEILQKNLDFFKEKYPALETALTTTETQLYDTKSRLETTEIELGATKVELGTTKVELGTTKVELGTTKVELGTTKVELGITKVELGTTKVELENTRAKLDDLILEYERAIAALLQAQRERFGRKTERFVDTENQQLSLFDDPQLTDESSESSEPPESSEVAPEDVEEITYTRKRTKNGTVEIPTREEIIAVPESERTCSCCGHEKDVIGYEESTRLDYKPAIFERVVRKREKMACRYGCGQVVVAVAPSQILPKCRVTESMLAYISVSKVLDRQPLYHLEKSINQRYQWHISRTTMARWMIQLSETLQPLVNLMKDEIEGYDVAAIDATTIQVLKEPGRSPETKSYAYCIRGGPPGKSVILYEYNAYRQGEYVESEGLPDFRGVIHCDASAVFNQIGRRDGVTLSYCHAHARRKFEQIVKASGKGKAKLATEAMQFYRRLYAIERSAKENGLSSDAIYEMRQQKSVPILAEFRDWLAQSQEKTMPQTPIGKAIGYTLSHWEGLMVYCTDGRLKMDNNDTERDIKPFVIARKNFLFACTQQGADALGVHFSLILTAQLHGLNPLAYYESILTQIPSCHTIDHYYALLPWNFTK